MRRPLDPDPPVFCRAAARGGTLGGVPAQPKPATSINRRRHRLFVTQNTEYHLRSDECVGVRDRESGQWLRDHAALRLRAIRLPPTGHDVTWVGRRIQFWGLGTDVVTSPVVSIGRPPKQSIERYISNACAGEIVPAR